MAIRLLPGGALEFDTVDELRRYAEFLPLAKVPSLQDEKPATKQIIECLKKHGPLDPTTLRQKTGLTRGRVNYALYQSGLFERTGPNGVNWKPKK